MALGAWLVAGAAAAGAEAGASADGRATVSAVGELVAEGRVQEAVALARDNLAAAEARGGRDAPVLADALDDLPDALMAGGGDVRADAVEVARRAVAARERDDASDPARRAASLERLGKAQAEARDGSAACAAYDRAATARAAAGQAAAAAADLLAVARIHVSERSPSEALVLAVEALPVLEREGASAWPWIRTGLILSAEALLQLGRPRDAELLLGRGIEVAGSSAPSDSKVDSILELLALARARQGDWKGATDTAAEVVALRDGASRGGRAPLIASLQYLATYASADLSDGRAAGACDRLGELERDGEPVNPMVRTTCHRVLAVARHAAGRTTEARSHAEKALAGLEAEGQARLGFPDLLRELGDILRAAGDLDGARRAFERGLVACDASPRTDPATAANLLNSLGAVLANQEQLVLARRAFEASLAAWPREARHDDNRAVALVNLAGVLETLGDLDAARTAHAEAVPLLERIHGPGDSRVGVALNNMATVVARAGDAAAARELQARALAIVEAELGPDDAAVAPLLINMGSAARGQGSFAEAVALERRALGILERRLGPEHPHVVKCLGHLGWSLAGAGDLRGAGAAFERALATAERTFGREDILTVRALKDVSRLRHAQGDDAAALDMALRAERVSREHARLVAQSLSEREAMAWSATRVSTLGLVLSVVSGATDLSGPEHARALDAVVRSRALVLDELASRSRWLRPGAAGEIEPLAERVRSARQELANLVVRRPGDPARHGSPVAAAMAERERAERALAAASSGFREGEARAVVGLADVTAALPPASVLISFMRHDALERKGGAGWGADVPSYLAFALRAGEAAPRAIPLGRADRIDGLVQRWRDGLASTRGDASAGRELRRAVLDPLAEAIAGARRVFVVPDGALHLVSLGALPEEAGGYVVERPIVLQLVSAERDLAALRPADRAAGAILAIGGPAYDLPLGGDSVASLEEPPSAAAGPLAGVLRMAREESASRRRSGPCGDFASMRFETLPAARLEAEAVRHACAGMPGTILVEGAATEGAVKAGARGRSVLHVATHGFFLGGACTTREGTRGLAAAEDAPAAAGLVPAASPLLLSGLALAGANRRDEAGPGDEDGILTAEEVASLDLAACDWAVLSACGTGLGDVRAGEGVLGLQRAFRVAGARTVVMSLWSVDDEATRAWMRELYRARFEERRDTPSCVRAASLAVLRHRRANGLDDSPFWWGAFVASGDWR